MTNKDILIALSEIRNRLYGTSFAGQQMLVVSDCIRILDATMAAINQEPGDQNVVQNG